MQIQPESFAGKYSHLNAAQISHPHTSIKSSDNRFCRENSTFSPHGKQANSSDIPEEIPKSQGEDSQQAKIRSQGQKSGQNSLDVQENFEVSREIVEGEVIDCIPQNLKYGKVPADIRIESGIESGPVGYKKARQKSTGLTKWLGLNKTKESVGLQTSLSIESKSELEQTKEEALWPLEQGECFLIKPATSFCFCNLTKGKLYRNTKLELNLEVYLACDRSKLSIMAILHCSKY